VRNRLRKSKRPRRLFEECIQQLGCHSNKEVVVT
jgi:hypothetical protein